MTRWAQWASISSSSASLSRPRRRNGPICSRGSGASSRTTGSGSLDMRVPRVPSPLSPWGRGEHVASSAHRLAHLDLVVDVFSHFADDAALLLALDQRQTLVRDPPQLLIFAQQVAHRVVDG